MPFKIMLVNKDDLLTNLSLDLLAGDILYYRNHLPNLLTSGIDILDTIPITDATGPYNIKFYFSKDVSVSPYFTITGNAGDSRNLPTAPIKSGFTFIGWNTEADGSGILYTENKINIKSEDFVLYAFWSEVTLPKVLVGDITSIQEYDRIKKTNDGKY